MPSLPAVAGKQDPKLLEAYLPKHGRVLPNYKQTVATLGWDLLLFVSWQQHCVSLRPSEG